MKKQVKILIYCLVFVFIIYSIQSLFSLTSNTSRLMDDYSVMKKHWKTENEVIDNDNEWLRMCKENERVCTEREREKEYKPKVSRTTLYNDFVSENPDTIFYFILWMVEIYLVFNIYDVIFPRIYTLNERHEQRLEGRALYKVPRGYRNGYWLKSPYVPLGWSKMFNLTDHGPINLVSTSGVIKLDPGYIEWNPSKVAQMRILTDQLEYDDKGYLYPGSELFKSSKSEEKIYQDAIRNILDKTEKMVRKGTRTNSENRKILLLNPGNLSGYDQAHEYDLDNDIYELPE